MADRTKLDFNFISLVLSVSGRVRPIDLVNIPEVERTNALRGFYDAHSSSMPLHFDGDVLVRGAGTGVNRSTESPASTPVPQAAAPVFEPAPPVSDYASVPASVAPTVPAVLAEPVFEPAPQPAPAVAGDDLFDVPPLRTEEPDDVSAPKVQASENVSFLWWLLPVLFSLLGGVIAFFLVRGRNPKRAKALLITGIVLTLLYAVLTVAAVVGLGLVAASSVQQGLKQGVPVTAPVTKSESTPPPVAADYPKWKIISDRGSKLTRSPDATDPNGRVREDRAYLIENPQGEVRILAWYARSAPDVPTLNAQPWRNRDTLFKATDGSGAKVEGLVARFIKDHPSQLMLGAYKWKSKTAVPTYWVGWAAEGSSAATATPEHGEYAYARSASGWHRVKTAKASGDAWSTTGTVK